MKVNEIAALIEREFPKELAEEWDNVGLLVGRGDSDADRILLTLDVTPFVVEEAVKAKADMIVAHHPVLFSGIKRITGDSRIGDMLLTLCRNNIAVYAAHTNMDSAKTGLNNKLAQMFGLKNAVPVEPGKYEGTGLGRIGELEEEMTAGEFAHKAKEILKTPLRLSGDRERIVKVVAVGSGACDDIIPRAKQMGADLVLTGDCKYHRNQEYTDLGITVIDAGHYPTEIIAMDMFEQILSECGAELIKSQMTDIFEFI